MRFGADRHPCGRYVTRLEWQLFPGYFPPIPEIHLLDSFSALPPCCDMQWDPATVKFVLLGELRLTGRETVYRVSGHRFQSRCASPCGWMGDRSVRVIWPGQGFSHRIVGEKTADGHHDPRQRQLVCVMPRHAADHMMSMHLNCNAYSCHGIEKLEGMRLFLNWTVDEAAYLKEVEGDPNRAVFEY